MIALLAALAFAGPVADGAVAYAEGRTEDAVAAWTVGVDAGHPSGAVLTNLGVAAYDAGDLPRALGWWRAARALRPRDADVSHDLATARAELDGLRPPAGEPLRWLELVTPGEVGGSGLLALAACFVALVLRRRTDGGYLPAAATGVVGLALVSVGIAGTYAAAAHPVVVVVDGPAIARTAAWAFADERFVLLPGTEVAWEQARGDFVLVRTSEGDRGWVPARTLFTGGRRMDALTAAAR